MIERCRDLLECERLLAGEVSGSIGIFLGEIPLSQQDIELLDELVVDVLARDPANGTRFLVQKAPTCFALFLVWQGIRGYDNGDYWSAVRESTGIWDRRYDGKWGEAFLRFSRDIRLAQHDPDGGHRYITPILFQGGIPDSCLPEYFREIAWRRFVSRGLTKQDDVLLELAHLREEAREFRQSGVPARVDALVAERRRYARVEKLLEEYASLTKRTADVHRMLDVLEGIREIEKEVCKLRERHEAQLRALGDAEDTIEAFTSRDRELLDTEDEALRCQAQLQKMGSLLNDLEAGHARVTVLLNRVSQVLFGVEWKESFRRYVSPDYVQEIRQLWQQLIVSEQAFKNRRRVYLASASGGGLSLVAAGLLYAVLAGHWSVWPLALTGLVGLGGSLSVALPLIHRVRILRTELSERLKAFSRAHDLIRDGEKLAALLEEARGLLEERRKWSEQLVELEAELNKLAQVIDTNPSAPGNTCPPEAGHTSIRDVLNILSIRVEQWLTAILSAKQRRQAAQKAEAVKSEALRLLRRTSVTLEEKERMRERLLEGVPGLGRYGEDLRGINIEKLYEELTRDSINTAKQLDKVTRKLRSLLGRDIHSGSIEEERSSVRRMIAELKQEQLIIERAVASHPLMWVERPIERFLLYGGDAADKFVVHTVALLARSRHQKQAELPVGWPKHYRYVRIWEAFQRWWTEEGSTLCGGNTRTSKPRLVCWREVGMWHVGIEVSEEVIDRPDLTVSQDGQELEESPRREGCWPVDHLDGTVEVRFGDVSPSSIYLNQARQKNEPVWVFRGWDDSMSPLPWIRKVGTGRVLVIVPEDWLREESKSGPAPFEPEPVAIPGYRAHFFDLAGGKTQICFQKPNGKIVLVGTGLKQFEIVGKRIRTQSEDEMGPLFIGTPPRLCALYENSLENVAGAEVFLRGAGRTHTLLLQPDRDWLGEGKALLEGDTSGCYWVVIYDRNRDEIERHTFRFVSSLKDIRFKPEPIPFCPPPTGHPETCVEFVAVPECSIDLQEPDSTPMVTIERDRIALRATFSPNPQGDSSTWEVQAPGGWPVPVSIVFDRVWWAITEQGNQTSDVSWTDRAVQLKKHWFNATSQMVLRVRWSRPGLVTGVLAGFDTASRRPFAIKGRGTTVEIPLSEFYDARPLVKSERQAFKVWFKDAEGKEFAAATIGIYQTPDDPDRRASCATCDFARHRVGWCRCTKREWKWIRKSEFDRYRAGYVCAKWQGEFIDEKGEWTSSDK